MSSSLLLKPVYHLELRWCSSISLRNRDVTLPFHLLSLPSSLSAHPPLYRVHYYTLSKSLRDYPHNRPVATPGHSQAVDSYTSLLTAIFHDIPCPILTSPPRAGLLSSTEMALGWPPMSWVLFWLRDFLLTMTGPDSGQSCLAVSHARVCSRVVFLVSWCCTDVQFVHYTL